MSKVIVRNLLVRFGRDKALDNVNLTLPEKGLIAIVGPSGCGKSTLLNALSGIIRQYRGSITLLGHSLPMEDEESLRELRLYYMGYVQQDFSLLELETVFDNVYYPLDAVSKSNGKQKKRRVNDLLRFVGMEKLSKKRGKELSGGEKQRVAIARALVNDPSILLADEPTGALDGKNAKTVFNLLSLISKKKLVILVTHDEASAYEYADRIVRMDNGKVIEEIDRPQQKENGSLETLRLPRDKTSPSLSLPCCFKHARHLINGRRLRSLISDSVLTLGLLSVGLASYVTFSLKGQISSSFNALVDSHCLYLGPKSPPSSSYSDLKSMKLEDALLLQDSFPEAIEEVGVDLHMDYEGFFSSGDTFALKKGASNVSLPYFSSRSINEFIPLKNEEVYPSFPSAMGITDVVLGLPYADMVRLCNALSLKPSFPNLGDYLDGSGLYCYLANEDMEFENEEFFDVYGVTQTDVPCFLHADPLWNHRFFVDRLHFRPADNGTEPNPQYVFEIPYFKIKDVDSFLQAIKGEKKYSNVILDYVSSFYLPTLWKENDERLSRFYAYSGVKHGLSLGKIDEVSSSLPHISGRLPIADIGYFATSGSMVYGFSSSFFLCKEKEKALETGEELSYMPSDKADLPLSSMDGVLSGSISSLGSGVRLSGDISNLLYGRAPEKLEEVAISSSLAKKWGNPNSIFVAAEVARENGTDTVSRKFSYAKLRVTGIKEDATDTLFVKKDWTVDFYLGVLHASGFYLVPTSCLLYFPSKAEAARAKEVLLRDFPDVETYFPSEEVEASIGDTSDYIGQVLFAFSSVALSSCLVLFLLILEITVEEGKKERETLVKIGMPSSSIARLFDCYLLLGLGKATAISLGAMVIIEMLLGQRINGMFANASTITLSPYPYAFLLGIFVLYYLIGMIYIRRKIGQKK